MLVKPYRDRTDDLERLAALAARPDCPPSTRDAIEAERKKILAGQKGERDAAYGIDFHLGNSDNWAVLHDLRIEWQGRVAQIDHLLVNRFLHVWLCESKHFSDGVAINEHGEFTSFFKGRPKGIESPIEQNHRHAKVLESVFGSSALALPSRLGLPIRPSFRHLVLVSAGGRISRPATGFPGLETVVKADQLRATINATVDKAGVVETFASLGKLIASETLRAFALQVAKLHRPIAVDWPAKFGLPAVEALPAGVTRSSPAASPTHDRNLISTSKLAGRLGLGSARQLLDALTARGLLEPSGAGHVLTNLGRSAGGVFVEKSRYGPYFVWPADLDLQRWRPLVES